MFVLGAKYPYVEGRPLDEANLVTAARNGDTGAYQSLVRRYQDIAVRTAYLFAGDEAEDAAQEAFMKAYASLWRFRLGAEFRPWLLRIVVNEAKNRRTAAGRRMRLALKAVDRSSGDAVPSPEAAILTEERRVKLVDALNRLADKDRTILASRYLLDLSEKEIAATHGLLRGTVKSRLNRAMAKLRKELGEDYAPRR